MKIYIPLNEKGVIECEQAIFENSTENMKVEYFTSEEYLFLETQKYLDFLNVECDCLIDLYEEENIINEKLNNALEITKIIKKNTDDEKYIALLNRFIDIFELAIECNTYVNIYCYGELLSSE